MVTAMLVITGLLAPNIADAASVIQGSSETVEALLEQNETEEGDLVHPKALIYDCEEYTLKKQPEGSGDIVTLYSGQQVFLLARVHMSDESVWYKVKAAVDDIEYVGYVPTEFLLCIDSTNLDSIEILDESDLPEGDESTEEATNEIQQITYDILEEELRVNSTDSTFEASIAGFPESYKASLRTLHASHPNWTFVVQITNIDWDTFIEAEMVQARNLVSSSMDDAYKGKQSWAYDPTTGTYIGLSGDDWNQASQAAVEYYADPRNFLTEEGIFQFELLTYNSAYQTETGVENILSGTFMSHTVIPSDTITYAQAFCKIGAAKNVSPYMLAARVRQEQGAAGTSPLISGTYSGYEGYYNYFNINAYGSTAAEIYVNGLSYAKTQGWNTRYNSLLGGAGILSANYISRGQDTLYLQKFDVDSSYDGTFWHQYMQNLLGAANEAKTAYSTYSNMGILENTFVFKIPVYTNMPSAACPKPDGDSVSEEQLAAFIERLYEIILGRASDESGFYHWYSGMVSGSLTAAEVARRFITSEEFTRQNISDEEFVERMYLTMMNRSSDSSGKEHWLDILDSGLSRTYVLSRFVASEEFTMICNSYGVTKGTVTLTEGRDLNVGATKFVTRLYRFALNREPDIDGLNHWAGMIAKKQATPYDVAQRIVQSAEFQQHNYSDDEYIRILYRSFLGREAETAGFLHWKQELANGCTRLNILKRFSNSAEFMQIVKSYGLS